MTLSAAAGSGSGGPTKTATLVLPSRACPSRLGVSRLRCGAESPSRRPPCSVSLARIAPASIQTICRGALRAKFAGEPSERERTRRHERPTAHKVTNIRMGIYTSIRVAGGIAASAWRASERLTKRGIRQNTSPAAGPSSPATRGLTCRGAVSGTLVCR